MTADAAAADTAAAAESSAKAAKTGGKLGKLGLPKDRNVLILSAVCVVLLLATAALAFFYVRGQSANSARTDALKAAEADFPPTLTYSYTSLSADMAKAESGMTANFRNTQYIPDMDKIIKPEATQNQVVASAAVTNASVISASGSRASILLFVAEQTKTKAKAESVLNSPAVQVTMVKQNGVWLMDSVTPHP